MRILGFADDLDIIGNALTDIANVSRALENAAEKVDLTINPSKTKTMEIIDSNVDSQRREWFSFKIV